MHKNQRIEDNNIVTNGDFYEEFLYTHTLVSPSALTLCNSNICNCGEEWRMRVYDGLSATYYGSR